MGVREMDDLHNEIMKLGDELDRNHTMLHRGIDITDAQNEVREGMITMALNGMGGLSIENLDKVCNLIDELLREV